MKDALHIVIRGEPTPKLRARHNHATGAVYTPKKNRDAIKAFRLAVIASLKALGITERPVFADGISLRADFVFYMPIPTSLSEKRRRELDGRPHIKKPDKDNLEKFAMDALTGICWSDDRQVSAGSTEKIYSTDPRTVIYITENERSQR